MMRRSDKGADTQPLHLYVVGMGSNRSLSRHMSPRAIIRSAMIALDLPPLTVVARAPVITTRPIGPSLRNYANSAVLVMSPLPPLAMLDRMQELEARFRRRRFRRWGDRTLDLDLLLWSGGRIDSRRLSLPHRAFRTREFVLEPLQHVARRWRDPVTGYSVAQLAARLGKPRQVDRAGAHH